MITDYSKVTIFIYENGNIEVDNADPIDIPDGDIAVYVSELTLMPEAEELTVKELKTIAKLLMMVRSYRANKKTYELEFDSDRVRNFWQTVTA